MPRNRKGLDRCIGRISNPRRPVVHIAVLRLGKTLGLRHLEHTFGHAGRNAGIRARLIAGKIDIGVEEQNQLGGDRGIDVSDAKILKLLDFVRIQR